MPADSPQILAATWIAFAKSSGLQEAEMQVWVLDCKPGSLQMHVNSVGMQPAATAPETKQSCAQSGTFSRPLMMPVGAAETVGVNREARSRAAARVRCIVSLFEMPDDPMKSWDTFRAH